MSEIAEYFALHARLSRRTLARFAETELEEVDLAADDLGFGTLLRLDEAEEVLAELERDEASDLADEDDEDGESDSTDPEEDE
jgi:hypothetical protein